MPRLSIVSTLYRSSATVREFVARSTAAAQQEVGQDYEIVLVNDGSPDDSLEQARALATEFSNLVIVDLSRNFGHHAALLEGLRQSSGDLVYLLDSDLEEQPEWLADFSRELTATGSDVVFGYQEHRKGSGFEKATGALYWKAFRAFSRLDIPDNIITARLMTRRYVDALLTFEERDVSIVGLFAQTGFKQTQFPVPKGYKGASAYPLRLKIWHAVNSISGYSTLPLTMIFVAGVGVSCVAGVIVVYLVLAAIIWNQPPVGWTSVIASVWFLGGLILLSIAVVATYLGKIFSETKGRPRVIVRSVDGRAEQ